MLRYDKLLRDGQITKNFSLNEKGIRCKHCNEVIVDDYFFLHFDLMQEFRDWYNRFMNHTSGHRCYTKNKLCGGKENSLHLKFASDCYYPSEFHTWSSERKTEFIENCCHKWIEICHKHGLYGGFGAYGTFMHFDIRFYVPYPNPRGFARWTYTKYFSKEPWQKRYQVYRGFRGTKI